MKFIVELSPGVYLGTGKSNTFHTNDITKASPCDTRDNAIQKRWRHKKRTGEQFPESRIVAVDDDGIEFEKREEFAPTQIPGIPQIEDDAILVRIAQADLKKELPSFADMLKFAREQRRMRKKILEKSPRPPQGLSIQFYESFLHEIPHNSQDSDNRHSGSY